VEEASFVHSEPPQDGSAPPTVSSDMEVLHDKVKKQVIKEGHGRKPLKFATCFGEYGGRPEVVRSHMLMLRMSNFRIYANMLCLPCFLFYNNDILNVFCLSDHGHEMLMALFTLRANNLSKQILFYIWS